MAEKLYKPIDKNAKQYLSEVSGTLCGHRKLRTCTDRLKTF